MNSRYPRRRSVRKRLSRAPPNLAHAREPREDGSFFDMHGTHEDVPFPGPCHRTTDGSELANHHLDLVGASAKRREFVAEDARNVTQRPAAEHRGHLLHDHAIEGHDLPRRAHERLELFVVTIARLAEQQQTTFLAVSHSAASPPGLCA